MLKGNRGTAAWLASRLLLSTVAGLFAVLLFELVFRAFDVRGVYHREHIQRMSLHEGAPSTKALLGEVPFATFRCLYDSNPRGYFGDNNEIDHAINSVGWRDVEHTVLKPESTYRIVGLGDSYLFGYGVRFEDIFFTQLGTILSEHFPGTPFELINTGVKGTNTPFHASLLTQRGLRYDPDLVMLNFVLNDIEGGIQFQGLSEQGEMSRIGSQFLEPDALSQWSNLWSWGRQRWHQLQASRHYVDRTLTEYSEDNPDWQTCKAALLEISAACASREIPLLIVIFPFYHDLDGDYPFQPIHDYLHQFFDAQGLRYLDLREYHRAYHGPELWVHPTDLHPNEIAHRIAAEVIAEYLIQHAEEFSLGKPKPPIVPFNDEGELHAQAAARVVQLQGALSDDARIVDLSGNPLTDADLQLIAPYWQGLPELEILNLKETNIADGTLKAIGSLTTLKVLDLSGTQVTASGLENLKPLSHLQQLGLAGLPIGDEALSTLTALPALTTLNLADTAITDDSAAHLAAFPNLQFLVLSKTNLTNASLDRIAELPNLTAVDLRGTHIDATALQTLAERRPKLRIVQ